MQASDLLSADATARATALDPRRSFIVQAPAGSGKTELLTQRFLALLPTVEKPEALLAITFTRKAAAEMRHRILEALRQCEDASSSLRPETRALARRVLQVDASRGWGVLRNPSRLRVLTIDALNQSLARRLPVLSGLGGGLDVEEQADASYEQAAERLLRHLPAAEAEVAAAVALVLEHLDNQVDRLVTLIASMLAHRDAWLPVLPADPDSLDGMGAVRRSLERARRAVVESHLATLTAAFPATLLGELCELARGASAVLGSLGASSPVGDCGAGVPGPAATHLAHWRGLAEFALTREGKPRRSFNRTLGVLPQDPRRPELAVVKGRVEAAVAEFARHPQLPPLLAEVRGLPPVCYEDTEWDVLRALLRVLRLAAAELKTVFAERGAADYPEFSAAARQALGLPDSPTDTALALDARLRHVLVDEFQDTSEAQVRLLEGLTAGWEHGDGRTLFLVGDPMQSIYRFRNAEVGLFLDVRDHGLGQLELEPLTLRVNFRSTRPVIDWINLGFDTVLPSSDDVLRGAVKFASSVAARGAGTDGGVHVHAFLRTSRRLEAATVADLAESRLREDAQARVGILVQGRRHLVDIVDALARRGIAFEATDIDPLAERPAVLDLLALTRALAHPGDRAAWLGVLRAPWCGLRLGDMHALFAGERDAPALELLRDQTLVARLERGARARLDRCLPVLEASLREVRRYGLGDATSRAWHALGGPATVERTRELDEALAYLDALAEFAASSPDRPVDFARLAETLQQLYAPARPHPDTRVELMTIHKAKGLQFDTVIVPGLDRVGRRDAPPLLRWLKVPGHGDDRLIVAPIAPSAAEARNPLHQWLGRVENEKLMHEKRRLLYVAATRAKHALHLLGTCAVDQHEQTGEYSLRTPDPSSALALLWQVPAVRGAFEARLAEVGSITGEAGLAIPRNPVLPRVPDGWRPPPPPAGPAIVVRELTHGIDERNLEFDWATETTRHVGTVVHRELQRLARSGATAPGDEAATVRMVARFEAELAELGVPAERRRAAGMRALEAVRRTLEDERGRWLLRESHADARSEFGVTGRIGDDLVSVVIDRTFVDATGTRWIVDYKTSTHEGAGLDTFLDNERERYRAQLERYARLLRPLVDGPIRLGLYFPLLSAWREWGGEQ